MNPKKLVDMITRKSAVDGKKIKGVEIFENFSFVSVPFLEAEAIIDAFRKEGRGKKPLVEKAKEKR
jgi:ATP-dependent RNA helicase DeaD